MAETSVIIDQWGNPYSMPDPASLTVRAIPDAIEDRTAIGSIISEVTPERLLAIFKAADSGDVGPQINLARDMMERDGHLRSVMQTRKLAVTALNWTIAAGGEETASQEVAELFRERWEEIDTLSMMNRILDAILQQWAVEQPLWDVDSAPWMLNRFEQIDARRLIWPMINTEAVATPRIRRTWGDMNGEMPMPGKFLVHSYDAERGYPGRMALCRAVAVAWMFKRFAFVDFAELVEKWGQPFLTVLHDRNASNEEIMKLLAVMAKSISKRVLAAPVGSTVDVSEGTAHITSVPQEKLIDKCDEMMSKAILGNTTTSDAASNNDSVSSPTHAAVTRLIRDHDAKMLANAINRDVIRPWFEFNQFPADARMPKLQPSLADKVDPEKRVLVYEKAASIGLKRVKAKQIYEDLAIEMPGGVPDVIELTAATAASMFGGQGLAGAGTPGQGNGVQGNARPGASEPDEDDGSQN